MLCFQHRENQDCRPSELNELLDCYNKGILQRQRCANGGRGQTGPFQSPNIHHRPSRYSKSYPYHLLNNTWRNFEENSTFSWHKCWVRVSFNMNSTVGVFGC